MFRSNLKLLCSTHRRTYSTHREAWLYIDSVFPIQIARWDLRHYIGILRQEHLLTALQSRLDHLSSVHNFHPIEFQPQHKDGGVFVRFSYTPSDTPEGEQLSEIESSLRKESAKHGSLPSWLGLGRGTIWLVKGSPWKEDMNRFASQILKITFEGPDIPEQLLYELCRPFGRITDLTMPSTAPAGAPRSATVAYQRIYSATIARNVIHGFDLSSLSSSASPVKTRLRAGYQRPIQVHVIRDWMSSHPKIMLPLLVFLFGTVTYTIFDPIRVLMVESKMLDWFDFRKFKIYHWLQANTLGLLSGPHFPTTAGHRAIENGWKERKDAEAAINTYLAELPTTITFVHGPQGSGKTAMLDAVLKQSDRKKLTINCRELHNTTSDSQLVSALAAQTGYWPIFTFFNSIGGLIDLASVGLIGQKAGVSSSLPEQLDQILAVVTLALKGVSSSHQSKMQRQIVHQKHLKEQRIQEARKRQAIIDGEWHDGRLDCVAGNGIMSELGVGDERFEIANFSNAMSPDEGEVMMAENEKAFRKQKVHNSMDITNSLPVVVIRNYAANFRSPIKEALLEALAQWAATLIENQIAHVIVLSDNRENAKRLAKALPTKPINFIPLSDADPESSLSFVMQKLLDRGIDAEVSAEQTTYVERLGGRASDLESLVHKVRNGMSVEEAVEDIIARGVVELRKNAFGDDVDDVKGLAWTREQAWKVIKMLSQSQEVPYYDMLVEFPFKGDEGALRNMEHAELIAIGTKDGRPSTIRPGRPVFRWVFEKLVNGVDSIFRATQELGYNEKEIAQAESKIKGYEEELASLVDTMSKEGFILRRSACGERARYIGEKMVDAERKVERLEKINKGLKKVLGKGDD
ncbi:hypothetical protein BYT27DRAFT_7171768 [Phlegmacium glaucopus]|nr:hypothetical protein BYT27DRAFT_7171768 [Phlegmacium glaucopus]